MASSPTLPPQAYTRETLTAAFNWLQTQSDSIRKQATNPDSLVSLYMRSQRAADGFDQDAPVSSQNFMSDLRNLAEGLRQFDSNGREVGREPAISVGREPAVPREPDLSRDRRTTSAAGASAAGPSPRSPQPVSSASGPSVSGPSTTVLSTSGLAGLNERSLAMIQEVKNQFNLSHDSEAMNMMVSVAYKTLKNLLT